MVAAVDMNGRMRRFDENTAEAVLESAKRITRADVEEGSIVTPLLKEEFRERINCLNTREFTRLVQKMGYSNPLGELAQRRCWGMLRPANIDQMKIFFHAVGGIKGVIDWGAGQGYNSNLLERMGVPVVPLEYAPVSWSTGKNVFYPKIKYMKTDQDIKNMIRKLAPTHAMVVVWAPLDEHGADQAVSPHVKLYRQCGGRALLVTGPKSRTGDHDLWPMLEGEWLRCYLHKKHSTTQPVGYNLKADCIRYFRPREEAELVEQHEEGGLVQKGVPMPPPLLAIPEGDDGREEKMPDGEDERGYRVSPINLKTFKETYHHLNILEQDLWFAFEHLSRLHRSRRLRISTGLNERELSVKKIYAEFIQSLGHLNRLAREEVGLDLSDRDLWDKMFLKQVEWSKKLYLTFRKKSNIRLPALPLASVLDQGFVPLGRSKRARRRAAQLLRKGEGEEVEWEV